jgi:hypothetical protein
VTTTRLVFAALVLAATSGCARERVAYEYSVTREPVRRSYRAPRPGSTYRHQAVGPMYPHGAAYHACNAACDDYWPDVYPHGDASHLCDGTCPSFAPPRPQRRSLSVDHVQSFTGSSYSSSSTTRVSAGVTTAFDAEPYDAYDAYPTSSRVVVYAHGHARHRCASSCASYNAPRRHVSVTVYGHGHRLHRCASSCSSFRAPVQVVFGHGHHSHRCWSGCSSYRAPVQVVFGHGHHSHRCWSGCSSYRAPVRVVFGHGHSSHRCHSGCGSWRVDERWSRRRGGVVVVDNHGHYRAPRVHVPRPHVGVSVSSQRRHGRSSWSGAGVSVGTDGVRVGVGFGARWGRRR